jgi:hypothetical protein
MAFTQEDRDTLIRTAVKVENMEGWMENLPCQQHPPECTQETRLKSLETTKKRAINSTLTALVGSVVAAIAYFIHRIGG